VSLCSSEVTTAAPLFIRLGLTRLFFIALWRHARLVEHSEDPDIDDPILEHAGGTLGTASVTPTAGGDEDSTEKGITSLRSIQITRGALDTTECRTL
jgi:hypothetical protein